MSERERIAELERHLLTCDGRGEKAKREMLEEYVALRALLATQSEDVGERAALEISMAWAKIRPEWEDGTHAAYEVVGALLDAITHHPTKEDQP